jgi:hypothetical protein
MRKVRKKEAQERLKYKFGAYDIETWGLDATKFAFGVVMWQDKNENIYERKFFDNKAMIEFMVQKEFKGYEWYAHNAGKFDLIGLLDNYLEDERFRVIINSGRLISLTHKEYKIKFLDSLNLFATKLENIGKAMNLPKGITPRKFIIGDEKQGIKEQDIEYCRRDVEILLTAIIDFNKHVFYEYGTNIGITIASTAQKVWLTNFLEKDIKVKEYDKYFRFSYYGGRTEVLQGKDKYVYPCYYHDFNSLYPSVMIDGRYPDPENLKYLNELNTDIKYIENYEGVSNVVIDIPDMKYPPLPFKWKNKLIFPVGLLKGYYNHNELRLALNYGAKIKKIYNTIYSKNTVNYFEGYIKNLYNKRLNFKAENNEMGNMYTKLLMNSLYGKFAQKIERKEIGFIFEEPKPVKGKKWIFEPYKNTNVGTWKLQDKRGETIYKEGYNNIILFASYTTSMARIKLFEAVQDTYKKGGEVYYTDTDSLITNIKIEDKKELGALKIEDTGILKALAPKVYKFYSIPHMDILNTIIDFTSWIKEQKPSQIKLKGINKSVIGNDIDNEYIIKQITTVKQALIRGKTAGKPIEIIKKVTNKDTKRVWDKNGNSKPININDIREYMKEHKQDKKKNLTHEKILSNLMKMQKK